MSRPAGPGPFATLGLPARAGLTDDEVRAAWRRVAAATHPDRADGGDPARFAAAAAAYTALRTRSGRGEALAGLTGLPELTGPFGPADLPALAGLPERIAGDGTAAVDGGGAAGTAQSAGGVVDGSLARLLARGRRGRPAVLLVRVAATAAVTAVAVIAAGWAPATAAVTTGAVTWLLLTARHDFAPPR
jgi:curved DNA-binding protein CbpA